MVAISESPTVPASTTTVQLGKLLDEYSEVAVILPVLAGLLVTSRLQLRGANALIVNLTIAAISRQIVHQLKHEATDRPADANGAGAGANNSAEDDYKVLHSVPGRLRLQIPQLREDQSLAKRLETSLLNDSIVSKVRINRAAASVVIHYSNTDLSELDLGLRLLKILDQAKQTKTATV